MTEATPPSFVQSLFAFPSREDLLQTIGDDGKRSLLQEADEIVAGKVRLFGGGPVPLQLAFDKPLRHWTEYEAHSHLLSAYDSQVPDIKFIWEPARFGWAFALGRAYHLTGDEKYTQTFWHHFEQFDEGNPPYLGPHWMNGQEVAIRLMALVWAAGVFETSPASSAALSGSKGLERGSQLAQSIAAHAVRIPPTLVYARSQNNNHLITEAAALLTAGFALPDHPEAPRWRELGWNWINRALVRQISSYGEYIQHSTNYHRLMLQAVLWTDAILRNQGKRWPTSTQVALTRAAHWLFSMLDPASGRTPNLGANDGALILPLSSSSFGDFRPTVQAAARAFLRTGLPSGPWDELSLWLGLQPARRTSDSDAYMTDHLRAQNSWAYLRASRFKSRLSHMDQLHFDLWWRGLNIAQDPGTYLYSAEPPWDNPFVSTRVHNTVTVDGRDQMTRGGRFLTLDWFPAYSQTSLETDEQILGRVTAYHKGYRWLGIRHERMATVYMDERWVVEDRMFFSRPGRHIFTLHWLLRDGEWKMDNEQQGIRLRIDSPNGWVILRVRTDSRGSFMNKRVSLVRAGELIHGQRDLRSFEGWFSPTYGQKVPALSLALEVTSSRSFSFLSEFDFPE